MFCPACNLTVRILKSESRENGAKLLQQFTCDNPRCRNYKKVTHEVTHDLGNRGAISITTKS